MALRILFYVLIFQGAYYLITAIWPIISLRSFMRFAGPKPDRFIFWTVDLLIIVIGTTILFGVIRGDLGTVAFLGVLSATAFMIVEVVFSGRISPYFWADFAVEAAIAVAIIASSLASI